MEGKSQILAPNVHSARGISLASSLLCALHSAQFTTGAESVPLWQFVHACHPKFVLPHAIP